MRKPRKTLCVYFKTGNELTLENKVSRTVDSRISLEDVLNNSFPIF
jgi:hypothetical protein